MNIIGALLFFAYIALAVLFTLILLAGHFKLARTIPVHFSSKNAQPSSYSVRIQILSILAVISFLSLSYTMMCILTASYSDWNTLAAADLLLRPRPTSILGMIKDWSDRIWIWSTSANFFSHFAIGILRTDGSRIWARLALVNSVVWSIWMSDIGEQWRIPNLSVYFFIIQLLPNSFSQIMFLIALELRQQSQAGLAVQIRKRPSQTPAIHLAYITWGIAFAAIMESADELTMGKVVVPRIFLIRSMLVAPYYIPGFIRYIAGESSKKGQGQFINIMIDGPPLALGWMALQLSDIQRLGWHRLFLDLQKGHPAIRALGYDLIMGYVSLATWILLGGVRRSSDRPRN